MFTTEDKCCICLPETIIRSHQTKTGGWKLQGVYSAEGNDVTKEVSVVVPENCGHGVCEKCFKEFLEHAAANNIPSDKIQCPTCRKVIPINQRHTYSPQPAEVDPIPGFLIAEAMFAVGVGALRTAYNMACNLIVEQDEGESNSLEKGISATVLVTTVTIVPTLIWGLQREYQRRQKQAVTAAKIASASKSD